MMLLIEKYIKYLRYEKNFSLHTEISYSTDLQQFSEFLKEHFPEIDIKAADSDIIRLWIVSLMEAKISARSVNRKLSTLKSFYKYLLRINEISINPVKKITGPKTPKPIPAFINNTDMDKILDNTNFDDSYESLRNQIMIELFYATGIRRAELIGLRDTDVDFSNETIQVTGKRNKQRIIPFSDGMRTLLEQYITIRDKEVENTTGYLFVRENGKQLYPMLVHRIIEENLKHIPTLSKTSPHVLRHSFATSMLNNGADINAVKELLGHSSLAATEIYTHTSFEELKKIYNKAHPRA
ncbi:tyrosine recombinase XerC [Dysgonomonas sp. Marseille-P4677]|uniref:tyrosine recombinase XerC n=1 Tax=Dysgonomonas sp. Marseille-P4677 TaxID=2364790 RepID=UPI0019140C3D|nr:tyrosine recombinase XerC [Dysgonomonas sp. Marseille-P4677]MBK5719321.1 tyrosine recombinase XerC [Dysgonomonas sp. Marseille-P4677]